MSDQENELSKKPGEPSAGSTALANRGFGALLATLVRELMAVAGSISGLVGSIAKILGHGPSKTSNLIQTSAVPPPAHAPDKSKRAADLDLRPQDDTASHLRWGTSLVVGAFAIAIAAGVGFLVAYWTGGSNWLLGGTLALFLGGLGVSLVLYSHWLVADKQATEPREDLLSNKQVREAVWKDFDAEGDFRRRSLLKWIGAGTAGMIGAIFVSLMRSLGPAPAPSLAAAIWKRGQRLVTPDGTPVTVNALQPGNFMVVFPEESIGDERAQTVLIRVNEHRLRLPKERANWAPMGYVAYSRVCTHAGCTVGLFLETTDLLMCPCHQSTFDVLRAAQPTGGPAPRPLPQLPLYADAKGNLRAGGGFTAPPGPGFWEIS